jgi:hypothetical protein
LFAGAIESNDGAIGIEHNHQRSGRIEDGRKNIRSSCSASSVCFNSVMSKATPWMNQGRPSFWRIILASQWNQMTPPSRANTL